MPAPLTGPRRSRRLLPLTGLALLLAAPVGASAATTVPAGAVAVSRGVCTTSATDASARAATFTVRMKDVPPSSSYGFSVRLEERLPGAKWKALKGASVPTGFGDFVTAKSGAPSLSRRFNVQGLHAGSSYRLRATYRWSTGGASRAVRRTSRACVVKDLRPHVGLTGDFGWLPSTAGGEVAYRIGLRADGLDALKGVDVPVVVRQGQTVLATGVLHPAAATENVLLPGKRCTQGVPVMVQIDPDGLVDARPDTDGQLTASCAPVTR
ncbi:hypothetical protein [Patulibacter minatonensis]|uniref:hypothetical protein n=1 Tax=Patulibacter minatonensis TaxID=298163 RepID=UPI00047BEA84|nr:hypothetical protein [Patulibacter minatonensis]